MGSTQRTTFRPLLGLRTMAAQQPEAELASGLQHRLS